MKQQDSGMSKVTFMRHGESYGNIYGSTYTHHDERNFLTLDGAREAHTLGEWILKRGETQYTDYITSGLTRSKHTMCHIQHGMGVLDPAPLALDELNEIDSGQRTDPAYVSYVDGCIRKALLSHIVPLLGKGSGNGHILAVTHGNLNKHIYERMAMQDPHMVSQQPWNGGYLSFHTYSLKYLRDGFQAG